MNPTCDLRKRIESVDLLRGLVMILMALDHTRDFFGSQAVSPTDPAKAGAALFFTRWITHFCAPAFFLLTGTGASLARAHRSAAALSRYLVTRGALLILLELTVLRGLAYQFNFDYRVTFLVVIWALGWAMIFLGALVFVPTPLIATIGAIMMAGHNLLDTIRSSNPIWMILHGPGLVSKNPEHAVFAAYPLIPWVGVTAVGYALGRTYAWPAQQRRRTLLVLGVGGIVGFLALRGLNVYGDPFPWKTQPSGVATLLAFLNANKYPPSLQYLLMTLGPAMLVLRQFDGGLPNVLRPTLDYGRAPFVYFIAHFFLIHALAVLVCLVRYGSAHWMFESPSLAAYPFTQPPGWGYPLPVVYLVWLAVVASLYPACRWMARLKAGHPQSWLSYI